MNAAPGRSTPMPHASCPMPHRTDAAHGTTKLGPRPSALRPYDLSARRRGLLDQLSEPFGEVGLALLDGQLLRALGHLEELVDEEAQVVGHAEEEEGGRLV